MPYNGLTQSVYSR